MCTLSVSSVIYHKFSHGATFYALNGKNVNVVLECEFSVGHGIVPIHLKIYDACLAVSFIFSSKAVWKDQAAVRTNQEYLSTSYLHGIIK